MTSAPILLVLIVAGLAFYEAFVGLRIMADVTRMSAISARSADVVRSTTMDDDAKGLAMRQASAGLFAAVGLATVKMAIALTAAALVVLAASRIAWPLSTLTQTAMTPAAIVIVTLAVAAYGYVRHGRRR